MTTTRYVNTASSAGGDGTTNATTGDNRAFASLSEAESNLPATFTDDWEIICEGNDADTTAVTIDGTGAGATYSLTVKTDSAATYGRHAGVWSATKYRLDLGDTGANALYVRDTNVIIDGLQITGVDGDSYCGVFAGQWEDCDFELKNVIIKDIDGNQDTCGIWVYSRAGNTAWVENCIIYNCDGPGIRVDNASSTVTVYNSTIYNCNIANNSYRGGIMTPSSSAVKCVNSISHSNNNEDFRGDYTSSDYNLSSDATAPGLNSLTNKALSAVDFESTTAGSEDFNLQSTSDCVGAGIGPASDSDVPTTDAAGETRSGSTTDIGALMYVAAGGTSKTVEGTFTAAGSLSRVFRGKRTNDANLTLTAAATRKASYKRSFSHALSFSGVASGFTSIAVLIAGALTAAGTLTRKVFFYRTNTGENNPAGNLSKLSRFKRSPSGSIGPTGLISYISGQLVAGAMAIAGALSHMTKFHRSAGGDIGITGIGSKSRADYNRKTDGVLFPRGSLPSLSAIKRGLMRLGKALNFR